MVELIGTLFLCRARETVKVSNYTFFFAVSEVG